MWYGSNDYSNGLNNYSSPRKNDGRTPKFLNDGTGKTALYCESSATLQGKEQPIASPQSTGSVTISSPLTISENSIQNWLGLSKEPLSAYQRWSINATLYSRIASRSGGFGVMALAILWAFGTLTWKATINVEPTLQNLHRAAQSRWLP
ncbi:hypothetical protein NSTC745_06331 [Nostoc sp. DSM 114161]